MLEDPPVKEYWIHPDYHGKFFTDLVTQEQNYDMIYESQKAKM